MQEITDEELDKIIAEKESKSLTVNNQNQTQPVVKFAKSKFAENMEQVKQDLLADASTKDDKFVKEVTDNLKEAAKKITEIEKDKASYEKHQIEVEDKKLSYEDDKTKHRSKEDKWENTQKAREHMYNGVKPIMKYVGIDEPLACGLTVIFTIVLIIPFFISKLWNGTIGALLCGATDKDRSKSMKGFIWTVLAVLLIFAIVIAIYLLLRTQNIDLLRKFK